MVSETTLTLAQVEAAQGRYSRSVQSPIYENYRDSARDVPDLIATVRMQQARIAALESELAAARAANRQWCPDCGPLLTSEKTVPMGGNSFQHSCPHCGAMVESKPPAFEPGY